MENEANKEKVDVQLELVSTLKIEDEENRLKKKQLLLEVNENNKEQAVGLLNEENDKKKIEDLSKYADELSSLIKIVKTVKLIRGYLFGILFALSMCMSNILVKMSPILDGSNHSAMRYLIQLIVMLLFIKSNKLEYLGPASQRKLLTFRGVIGCAAVIISFFSIRYLDVSDVETLTNSCVLITAVIARIVLKEKLAICHLVALVFNVVGVVFIIRPNFLFGIEENVINALHLNLSAPHISSSVPVAGSSLSLSSNGTHLFGGKNISSRLINGKQLQIIDHSNRDVIETIVGVTLVLLSAACMSCAQVTIRKLCINKIHFSITSIYPAYVGLPASILVTALLIITSSSHSNMNEEAEVIGMQILQSVFAGVFGTLGIIFLNKALKYEDPTKIGMVKMIGVLFSFILQYIFLDISIDVLGVLGAMFVVSGVMFVMMMKLYEKKYAKPKNAFIRLLFYKF